MNKLVVAIVIVAAAVSTAEARFLGILRTGTPVEIEVVTNPTNGGSTAVTATWIKGNSLALVGSLTAGAGESQSLVTKKVPKSVTRLIVLVDLPAAGSVLVKVNQGAGLQFEQPVVDEGNGGTRFVWDVLPAP